MSVAASGTRNWTFAPHPDAPVSLDDPSICSRQTGSQRQTPTPQQQTRQPFARHAPASGQPRSSGDIAPTGRAARVPTAGLLACCQRPSHPNANATTTAAAAAAAAAADNAYGVTQNSPFNLKPLGRAHRHGPLPCASLSTAASAVGTSECALLLNRYDPEHGDPLRLSRCIPRNASDLDNARTLRQLQKESMRGAPPGAASFEGRQQVIGAKIAALPPSAQDYYRGAQAAFIALYEGASGATARNEVAQRFQAFAKTVDTAYKDVLRDPIKRVQSEFNPPYGFQCLGEDGQRMSALLDRYRTEFKHAGTARQRETAFADALGVRHRMQQAINAFATQKLADTRRNGQQAYATVDRALNQAKAIEPGDPYDREISFTRLAYFAHKVFDSPENAQAFKAMQRDDPGRFAILKQWEADVQEKTKWARQNISSDPFRRAFAVPDVPASYLDVDENAMPTAHYGSSLLDRYQTRRNDVDNAQELYHAACQRGPIKRAYVASATPPAPEWQQELEEIVCRLLLAPVPFGGVLADRFGPRSAMSDDLRKGIEIVCGLFGRSGLGPLGSLSEYGNALSAR